MESEVVKLRCHELWVREDGITHLRILPNSDVTLKDAEEVCVAIYEINKRKRNPLLVDMRAIGSMKREARTRYANEERSLNSIALLVDSPISRVVGNFFIGLNKLVIPTQLFTSEEKAIGWLKESL